MKDKLSTQPYKGARDFYPEDMLIQNYIFDTWKKVCKSFGYQEYSFPILEPFEIFAAKTGEEIVNNQLLSLVDAGNRKIAIRPELTPGTVRMIAQRYKALTKPLRWYMIGNNWRYEKPQKGRGREFYQLEVNIFGVGAVTADFEIFSIIIFLMQTFGATSNMFRLKISDRRLISALLQDVLKLEENIQLQTRKFMDKKTKMPEKDFREGLREIGLNEEQTEKVVGFMNSNLEGLPSIIPQNTLYENKGYVAITEVFKLIENAGLKPYCEFDPSIIRGFDYSDGMVYEVFDLSPDNRRSLFGGERFDKLIEIFADVELPSTGFALGDMTLLEFLVGWNLLPHFDSAFDYLVTLWPVENKEESDSYFSISQSYANYLRSKGFKVLTWLEQNTKLEKQLKYADKMGVKNVVLIGPEEIATKSAIIKDLETGKQKQDTIKL